MQLTNIVHFGLGQWLLLLQYQNESRPNFKPHHFASECFECVVARTPCGFFKARLFCQKKKKIIKKQNKNNYKHSITWVFFFLRRISSAVAVHISAAYGECVRAVQRFSGLLHLKTVRGANEFFVFKCRLCGKIDFQNCGNTFGICGCWLIRIGIGYFAYFGLRPEYCKSKLHLGFSTRWVSLISNNVAQIVCYQKSVLWSAVT